PVALRRAAEPRRIGRVVGPDRELALIGELELILCAGIGRSRLATGGRRCGRRALLRTAARRDERESQDEQGERNSEPHGASEATTFQRDASLVKAPPLAPLEGSDIRIVTEDAALV